MPELIETKRERRLLHITLNRPDKRNALNLDLCSELVAALDHADADRTVGAVLLTANGPAFCAGMDLSEATSARPDELNRVQEQLFGVGNRMATPVVVAVQGAAMAGGTGLVAGCHVAIAAADARFGLTEIRIGLWPFLVFRPLTLAMGERRTVELALTGRIFGAAEALEYGLIHEVAPPELLLERARQTAQALSEASATATRSGLMFAREVRGRDARQTVELARDVRNQAWKSADFQEGLRAYKEKREPQWPSIR
jgi:enoyl-CoA hydratase/carnithine racemase